MTETAEQTSITVSIELRLATSDDFRRVVQMEVDGRVTDAILPKHGQPYWLRSMFTQEVDNKNYQIDENIDWDEFKNYLRLKMVYVPKSYFELKAVAS